MSPIRPFASTLTLAALALVAAGCGESTPLLPGADGGRDAGTPDAAMPDASTPDASTPDAGPGCEDRGPDVPDDPTLGAWAARYGIPGVGGDLPNVEAFAFRADGTVYIGGSFSLAGYAQARNIASWTGVAGWRAMGEGLSGRVRSIAAASGATVYASYTPDATMGWDASRLARWDGTSWTTLTDAENGSIEEIVTVGDTLIVAGSFTRIGGIDAAGLARFDGTTWSTWAGLAPDGSIEALSATSLSDVCVGGEFDTLGVVASVGAACWNGTTWEARSLPSPDYPGIFDLARDTDGSLVAAGNFMIDPDQGGSIARWQGGRWQLIGGGVMVLGPGSTGNVRGLAVTATGLYVAGSFSSVGGSAAEMGVTNVARWDGSAWHDIGGLIMEVGIGLPTENVWGVGTAPDGSVYFGGLFTRAGTARASHVVRWDGTYWSTLRTPGEHHEGPAGGVWALARHGACTVYVGGDFAYAGDVRASAIASYTRAGGFEAMGDGVLGAVTDIAVTPEGVVYAAGEFVDADTGTAFANVARWDGERWSGLGTSVHGRVWAVAVDPASGPDGRDLVYVGGDIDQAGGTPASRLAVWDGERWAEVGGGIEGWPYSWDPSMRAPGVVYDLLVDPATHDLIVAGGFERTGGVATGNIARWDGEAWHAYGEGLGGADGTVHSLEQWQDRLAASGSFGAEGGPQRVASWTGTAWEQVGASAIDGFAMAQIVNADGVLFGGGVFAVAEGEPQTHIAFFDGTRWRALGGGVSDVVEALVVMDEGVYIGGGFARAGGEGSAVPSVGLALWQFASTSE